MTITHTSNPHTNSIEVLFNNIIYDGFDAFNIFSKYKIIEKYQTEINYYLDYIVNEGDTWDLISTNFYGTPNLWWMIAIFNNIVNPFDELKTGYTLKIIKPLYLQELLLTIRREHSNS